MSPSPRAAILLGAVALFAAFAGSFPGGVAAAVLVGATIADALVVRRPPHVRRELSSVLARGVPAVLSITAERDGPGSDCIRQPVPPDLAREPAAAAGQLRATLVPLRRGHHALGPVAVRSQGPLKLGRWQHEASGTQDLLVYPDVPAARRLALAVRSGRFRDAGRLTRGPLGLGTYFESVRDYVPDDDVRQVNWRATQRLQKPMSNQYRVEQDREVMLLVDAGRLMAAPLTDRTRLDAAVDAAISVAAVADVVGDRAGVLAFDRVVRRSLSPRHRGGEAVIRVLCDLEASTEESDYELAFRQAEAGKRSLVLIFCDLLEETAARPLIDAVPVLSRRHAVMIASTTDPDLQALIATPPSTPEDVYAAGVALEVMSARTRVRHELQRAGARVIEAPAGGLGAACVSSYLSAKARARL